MLTMEKQLADKLASENNERRSQLSLIRSKAVQDRTHDEKVELLAEYVPSPSEIARECEEIRRGWSRKETRKRLVDERRAGRAWDVPEVEMTEAARGVAE